MLRPAVCAPAAADSNSTANGLTTQFSLTPGAEPAQQSFHVDADRIQIQVQLSGQSAAPSAVVCDGNVVLREVPLARTDEQPFEIRGGKLTVDQLDSGTAHITLTGVGPGDAAGVQAGATSRPRHHDAGRFGGAGPARESLVEQRARESHAAGNSRPDFVPSSGRGEWPRGDNADSAGDQLAGRIGIRRPHGCVSAKRDCFRNGRYAAVRSVIGQAHGARAIGTAHRSAGD